MNEKALRIVLQYAGKKAKRPPISFAPLVGWPYCEECGARFVDVADADDENQHEDDCLWRLLKEALANLDNEGYE